jgi:hypothetical protein
MQVDHPVGLLRMVIDVRRDGPVAVEELVVLTHEAEEGLRVEIAQIIHDARRDANSCMHAIRGVELPPSGRGHQGSSRVINGDQGSSIVIKGHQLSSKGHQW